jgi:hypothetical protein
MAEVEGPVAPRSNMSWTELAHAGALGDLAFAEQAVFCKTAQPRERTRPI